MTPMTNLVDRSALLGQGEDGTFSFFVPCVPLQKGAVRDLRTRDGAPVPERLLEGLVSTERVDQQEEVVRQSGIDFGYLLDKGFLNWNHSHDPKDQIGEPLEAYLVPHGANGSQALFMRGFLYGSEEDRHKRGRDTTADGAWDLVQHAEFARSQGYGRRRIGWSVEGGVLFRQGKTLEKTIVRQMALTHEPVNADTYVKPVLAKSEGFALDGRVVLDTSNQLPHFDFGTFDALAKSLSGPAPLAPTEAAEKTLSTGLFGSPAGSGSSAATRHEQLDATITQVLPFFKVVDDLFSPCKGGRNCHDGQEFHGRQGLLTHVLECRGEDGMKTARALARLHRSLTRA